MTALRHAVATHPAARPKDGDAVYALRNVSKAFGRGAIRALDHVDLTLERGTFSSIIGPSGCGKSTLLKIMAGLTPPSSGSVMLEGQPVTGPRRDIGMMFQQATLFPWRTTIENILLPIAIRDGTSAAKAKEPAARALLDLVGLNGFAEVYPDKLSGGMAQRAAICRMLVTEPSVLLLDEPFSALDKLSRDFMNMELQRICLEKQATAFLITHSIPEAVILSDIVYVMSKRPGRFVETIHIELDRPRTLDMLTSPELGEYVRHIRALLDEGGQH